MKRATFTTIGTRVKVWVEGNRGLMVQVGSGYIRTMGMGVLEIQSEGGHNTTKFDLQSVIIEPVLDDPNARPLFI